MLLGYGGFAWGFAIPPLVPCLAIPVFLREIWLNEHTRSDPRPSSHLTAGTPGLSVPLIYLLIDMLD